MTSHFLSLDTQTPGNKRESVHHSGVVPVNFLTFKRSPLKCVSVCRMVGLYTDNLSDPKSVSQNHSRGSNSRNPLKVGRLGWLSQISRQFCSSHYLTVVRLSPCWTLH